MGCTSIPFRRLPHHPKLFVRFIDDYSSVARFYPRPPTVEAIKEAVGTVDYPDQRRAEIAEILRNSNQQFGPNEATERNLKLFENGAVAVVSGQQVGLFGGPAYAFYKALSAIRVAEELNGLGISAVPVFWMATEDHDVDEVRHTTFFEGGKLERLELADDGPPGRPVGQRPLGPAGRDLVNHAAGLLTGSSSEAVQRWLLESYTPDDTYGSAFGKLFARIFQEYGLILLDPLDARLHRVAAPVYRRALAERDVLNDALLKRAADLEGAGFDPQVKVTAKSTLLFRMKDGVRQPISAENGSFKAGGGSWTREESLRLVEAEPETFSPNALLRPVVQDYLLPTVAFLAGPAEISYLAQSEVAYRQLLGRMPAVLPRAAFTLLDAKAEKLLQRYQLCIENIWEGAQELRRRMEAVSLPRELGENFDRGKTSIEKTLAGLGEEIRKLDATLSGAFETAREKMTYQLEKLREKTGRAIDERSGVIAEHVTFLENFLYPNKSLQSRELSFLPFLAQWGPAGLNELKTLAGTENLKEHRIVRIS